MNSILRRGRVVLLTAVLAITVVFGVAAQTGGKMKISITNYQMEPTDPNGEMIKWMNDKFNADIQVVNIDKDKYQELLNIKLAVGEIPDLLYLDNAATLGTYVKQGILAKLTPEMIQKNAPNIYKTLSTYAPGYLDMGKVNGTLYGIPGVNPTNIFHIPLVYRQDWMKKVGVTKTPETLAEFEALMYKFANTPNLNGDGKKTYGLSLDGFLAVFGAWGLAPMNVISWDTTDYWVKEGGKVINSSTSKYIKDGLTLLAKWYKDGVIDPEFITGENQGGYWALSHSFIRGRIGFTTHANYYHYAYAGAYNNVDKNGKKTPNDAFANGLELFAANPTASIAFGNPIQGPTGVKGIKSWNRLSTFMTISKLAEKTPGKIEKILQILDKSASPDFVERVTMKYGAKDKYWSLVNLDTETIDFLPPYDKDNSYWSRIGAEFSMEMPLPPKAAREQWAYSNNLDKNGIESLIQVGLPLANKYKAELHKMRDEAFIAIITGAKPVSYFDEFLKAYMAAGGAQVEQEANEYYAGISSK